MKRWIVTTMESACTWFHWLTHHRPWLWLPIRGNYCLLALWSAELDERWNTGVWTSTPDDERLVDDD